MYDAHEINTQNFTFMKMNNYFNTRILTVFAACFSLSVTSVYAQCINTAQFGSATVGSANTTPVTITTAQWAEEYAIITVQNPGVYSFNSSVATDYMTITDASNNVLSHGLQPHPAVFLASGTYRMHINTNASCGTQQTSRTTSVNYLQGVPSPLVVNAPQNNNASSTLRMFNGTSTHTTFRNAYMVFENEFSDANIDPNSVVSSIGFVLSTASAGQVTANAKIYLLNSTDVQYNRGSDWSLIIPGMTLVYDAAVTIPSGVTTFDINLATPFTYTGDNVYIATEWELTSTPLTAPLTYLCNNAITGNLFNGQSGTTTAPLILNQVSAWRPEVRWGVQRKANDFEVTSLFAKGSNVETFGYPEDIQVLVTNNGFLSATKTVSLAISGANTFNATQSVTLSEGQDTLLTFSGFNPTNTGFNSIMATVPPDMVAANDTIVWVQETTNDRMGYADTTQTGLSGVGYNTGAGLLLIRLGVQGDRAVEGVRVRFSDNLPAIGNTVYGVVLDSTGAIIRQTPNHIITAANLENYHTLLFDSVFIVSNEDFYIGLAQTANATTGYFPLAFQGETPTRANAYFTAGITGVGLAPVANFRLMVEAVLGDIPCFDPANLALTPGCDDIEVTWTSNAGASGSTIEYGPTGFTLGTGTRVSNVTSPHTIAGLAPGTYDVYVADSCDVANVSSFIGPETATTEHAIANINISNIATAVFEFDATSSVNATSYIWDFGDGTSSTNAVETKSYAANGTYLVTLIATNACSSDTLSDSLLVSGIGVTSMLMPDLRVFPNPATTTLILDGLPSSAGKSTVRISDMRGRVVGVHELQADETLRLSLESWASGVYHISINNRLGTVTRSITVVK
ncbi:MAG: T9SS C-terminal target domain-containing protein [Flavobacteriales bacterium]|nr:MAG: T9SS C-terminal target domain-containing protein [Flavobacteriales bacterium]